MIAVAVVAFRWQVIQLTVHVWYAVCRPAISGTEVLRGRLWRFTASVSQNLILCQLLLTCPLFLTYSTCPVVALRMATVFVCICARSSRGSMGNPFWGLRLFWIHTYYRLWWPLWLVDLLLHTHIFPHRGHVSLNSMGLARMNSLYPPCWSS